MAEFFDAFAPTRASDPHVVLMPRFEAVVKQSYKFPLALPNVYDQGQAHLENNGNAMQGATKLAIFALLIQSLRFPKNIFARRLRDERVEARVVQVDLGEIGFHNLDAGEMTLTETLSELYGVDCLGVEQRLGHF